MFIEVCLLSAGLHYGSNLFSKVKHRLAGKQNKSKPAKQLNKDIARVERNKLSEKNSATAIEKEVNHNLAISIVSANLAIAGALFYTPLSLLAVAGMLYGNIPIFRVGLNAVFRERKSRIEIFDSIAILAALASGYYVITGLLSIAYFGAHKLRLKTENKVRNKLINVFGEYPGFVWILKDGAELEIPFESLETGDVLVVNAGEMISADGVVVHGMGSVDQRMLTGEAQPVEKETGSQVFATTIVISGNLHIQAEKTGKETAAVKITDILENTDDFTRQIEASAQEIADYSVIPALALSFGALPFVGTAGTVALLCSNYLVNMRIASPLGMLNYLHYTAKEGILIKDGRSLQLLSQADTVVFDKTGTLTLEQPCVYRIHTLNETDDNRVLMWAAAAEHRQTHPIALAILEEARIRKLEIPALNQSEYKIGYGITVNIGSHIIRVGSQRFMDTENIFIPKIIEKINEKAHHQGNSLVFVADAGKVIGAIELESLIRPEIPRIIKKLKKYNMFLCIISGDHENPTRKMAERLGIDAYFAEVLPEDKADMIDSLQKSGKKVCFVGDGINDSIALKKANVSISMRGASTAAIDSAQIVLMDQTLQRLTDVFDIAYDFKNNMENTFYSVSAPGILSIGGIFFAHFTILHATVLYGVSLTSGMIAVMMPALKKNKDDMRLIGTGDKGQNGKD